MDFKKPGVMAAVAAVVLAASVFAIVAQSGRHQRPSGDVGYYVDLTDGQLKVIPTAQAEGQPQLVVAVVVSCGDCGNPDALQVGWIESMSDEARDASSKLAAETDAVAKRQLLQTIESGRRVAAAPKAGEEPEWHPTRSLEGQQIVRNGKDRCDDSPAQICRP